MYGRGGGETTPTEPSRESSLHFPFFEENQQQRKEEEEENRLTVSIMYCWGDAGDGALGLEVVEEKKYLIEAKVNTAFTGKKIKSIGERERSRCVLKLTP